MSRPNIVFMIADDHRYNAIHALGNAEVRTPHFDQLVHQGTALTHTYIMGSTSGAVCMPSRAMLLTGRSLFHSAEVPTAYPYRIPEYAQLLPEAFREQGYMTYGVGKWHNPKSAYARCFEGGANIFFGGMSDHDKVPIHDFDPTGAYPDDQQYIGRQYSTDLFGDAAIDFLENYTDERPFFLYVAFTAPHDPRTPPPEFEYDPASVSVPENFLPEHPFDNGVLDIRDELLAPFPRTPEIVQQHMADYYGMISDLDDKVGQILKTLENRGLAENTIVVYTADHGLSVGQHGLLGKQNLYDHPPQHPVHHVRRPRRARHELLRQPHQHHPAPRPHRPRGMRFDNCFCTNSICTPSRASILTGTYNHINGVTTLSTHMDNRLLTFPEAAAASGYQTAIFGKWHLGTGPDHCPTGFDDWAVLPGQGLYHNPEFIFKGPDGGIRRTVPGYVTDLITDMCLDWLDERDPTGPSA
jgi:arylsulfatase A-like enzyme